MAAHVKIAISLPREEFRRVERERRRTRKTRSRVIRDALTSLFAREEEARKIRAYVEGYRRMPEIDAEMKPLVDLGLQTLADEEWS